MFLIRKVKDVKVEKIISTFVNICGTVCRTESNLSINSFLEKAVFSVIQLILNNTSARVLG